MLPLLAIRNSHLSTWWGNPMSRPSREELLKSDDDDDFILWRRWQFLWRHLVSRRRIQWMRGAFRTGWWARFTWIFNCIVADIRCRCRYSNAQNCSFWDTLYRKSCCMTWEKQRSFEFSPADSIWAVKAHHHLETSNIGHHYNEWKIDVKIFCRLCNL